MEDINENGTAGAGTEEKKFTQADVDAIIEGRLAREKQKYADYEDLKEKAGKYEVLKNSSKTEAEKTADQIADLQKQLEDKIPGSVTPKVVKPQGILLLGRSKDFNHQQKTDFELIKRQYKHIAEIMTYDDLLQRIENIIAALSQELKPM